MLHGIQLGLPFSSQMRVLSTYEVHQKSSKDGKEFLLYLAKRILFGQVFEASLNSWMQLYRLNSLLPLAGNPKSFLTFSVFIAVTKLWAPYGNLGSRTGIIRTHALASGSI